MAIKDLLRHDKIRRESCINVKPCVCVWVRAHVCEYIRGGGGESGAKAVIKGDEHRHLVNLANGCV